MSTLKVNKLRDTAGSADAITLDPSGGAVLAGVTTISTARVTSGIVTNTFIVGAGVTISESGIEASGIGITCANINGTAISGRRNMLYNGEMSIAQRGTTSGSGAGGGYDSVDRWEGAAANGGSWTSEQVTDAPDGYKYSYKRTITTANTTVDGGQYLTFRQRLEGQDLQHLKYGTTSAVPTTLSFWVKSNKTGTYTVSIENEDTAIFNGRTYTINSAGTWEYKTITYVGQKTEEGKAGPSNDTGPGIEVQWWLKAGANFTSGTMPDNTWQSTANKRVSASQVNVADAVSNYWQITGIQWEVGSQATPFEHRSFGDELGLCQRYYQAANTVGAGYGSANGYARAGCVYATPMRATPTLTATNTGSGSIIAADSSATGFYITYGSLGGSSAGIFNYVATAEL